uniref:Putative adenylylsulphate kinase n=1 Tax=uncultured marine microorganism HF4000_141I21 TaxID=455526 RepID=B3T2I6_9ZZZZ|nr:putative adenylylsulphate kinase [uncultured marine microorganism HF4000_141I21]
MKKILIMGLPGSGKSTLASELVPLLKAKWLNNDKVRKAANDWDFSEEGRVRQAKRMADLAEKHKQEGNYVVCDFICPTPKARELFNADFIVWVDTIKKGKYDDTNAMFVKPEKFDFHVTNQDAKVWATQIAKKIK